MKKYLRIIATGLELGYTKIHLKFLISILKKERRQLLDKSIEQEKKLDEVFNVIKNISDLLRRLNNNTYEKTLNCILLVTIASKEELIYSNIENTVKEKYHKDTLRGLFIMMGMEYCATYGKVFNEMRKELLLNNLNHFIEELDKLNSTRKSLAKLFRVNKEFRNEAIAHKTISFDKLNDLLSRDYNKFDDLRKALFNLNVQMMNLSLKILGYILNGLIRDDQQLAENNEVA